MLSSVGSATCCPADAGVGTDKLDIADGGIAAEGEGSSGAGDAAAMSDYGQDVLR